MNKVITINLNGKAYQLEEEGCKALQHYLDQAASKLSDNPDKEEVVRDLEQAFAEKCDQYLFPHKDVVLTKEIQTILEEMGPVDPANEKSEDKKSSGKHGSAQSAAGEEGANKSDQGRQKRLYQILDGAYISGVCNGIAVYFDVDVTLVRVIFVILTILTHGAWILVYFLMMVIVPVARTADQKAEAHGQPLNAAELIQMAKDRYKSIENDSEIKKWKEEWSKKKQDWKEKRVEWKKEWYENKAKAREAWAKNHSSHEAHQEEVKDFHKKRAEDVKNKHENANQNDYKYTYKYKGNKYVWKDKWQENYDRAMQNAEKNFTQGMSDQDFGFYRASMAGSGLFSFLGTLILIALALICAFALWSLYTTHFVFGYAIGLNDPLWMVGVFVFSVFLMFFLPFKLLVQVTKRHAAYVMPFYSYWGAAWTTFIWLLAIGTAVYTGLHLFPQLSEILRNIWMHFPWNPVK